MAPRDKTETDDGRGGAGIFLILLGMAVLPGLYIWYEHALWAECRAKDGFFYCLRILGWF